MGERGGATVAEAIAMRLTGCGQAINALVGVMLPVTADHPSVGDHAVKDADPQLTGQVAVTRPRCAQCMGAGMCTQRVDGTLRRKAGEGLENAFNMGRRQSVVAASAMLLDGDQPTAEQVREVTAGRRGGDAGFLGESAGRKRPSVSQRQQNSDASRICERSCYCCQIWFATDCWTHTSTIEAKCFDLRRSVDSASWSHEL